MDENNFQYEIIFINDGSTDRSWQVILELGEQYEQVKAISFRRNYGKSAALHEGFKAARGQVVITMDADLQDSPDEIPELYRMIKEDGYDLVSGWKKRRFDSFIKNNTSKVYNGVTRLVSGIKLHDFNCGLKSYRIEVVKAIEVYGEMHRYIPVIAKWAGFKKIGEKAVQHRARKYGVTKFGLSRFINGFLDLMSITFTSRFGKKPMHFFGLFGTLSFMLGTVIAFYIVIEKAYYSWILNQALPREVTERPWFFIGLFFAVIGVQLFLAGFLGDLIFRNSSTRNVYHKNALLKVDRQKFKLED